MIDPFPLRSYFPFFLLVCSALLLTGCGQTQASAKSSTPPGDQEWPAVESPFRGTLDNYWYQGKAEINTYTLEQARYGELHPGEATMVFVSEDFLTDKQVKNDRYQNPNSTPILKTNAIRRFTTGVYDYSIMNSVFTPTKFSEHPHTLKVTTSSQDWCGQSFAQLNYEGGNQWKSQFRSYFENEGDQNQAIEAAWLEDEVYNRLRIDPKGLPIGTHRIFPAQFYLMLMHQPFAPVSAEAKRGPYSGDDFSGENLDAYTLHYPSLDRTLEIVYETEAPHRIVGWTDVYPSRGRQLKSKATLSKSLLAPYWQENSTDYAAKRDSLNLAEFGR